MPSFSPTSLKHLETLDLRLKLILNEAIKTIDFKILEGHRNEADQEAAVARKASKVHWPDGKHNSLPSKAVDVAPGYFDRGFKIDFNDLPAFGRLIGHLERIAIYKGIKTRPGMDWDMDWRSEHRPGESGFFDGPHLEVVD